MSRLRGVQFVDPLAGDADLAAGDAFEPGDRVEQGRLAAARRAHEHQKPALLDIEVDAFQDLDGAETLLELLDFEECHVLSLHGAGHQAAHEIAA